MNLLALLPRVRVGLGDSKMPVATEAADQWLGKEQVVNDVPKVIKELHFGVLYDLSQEDPGHL